MKKIFYVAPAHTSFVDLDLSILTDEYAVVENFYSWQKKWAVPFYFLAQVFYFLRHSQGLSAVIVSTGGYWSVVPVVLAKVFGIPSYIILNGSDCASLPSLGYGALRKPMQKRACHFSYKMATQLLPVSDSLMKTHNSYHVDQYEAHQGIQVFFPELKTKWTEVPNGFNLDFWEDKGEDREKGSFVAVFAESQFHLKGGPFIEDLARRFPQCKFHIVGMNQKADSLPLDNLKYHGRLEHKDLSNLYNQVDFYLQLSLFEGFGCALCEAMLSGCIPIVSDVNILQRIVDSVGFVAKTATIDEIQIHVEKALSLLPEERQRRRTKARLKIVEDYPISNRQSRLFELLTRS